jgi:hypothetical protein
LTLSAPHDPAPVFNVNVHLAEAISNLFLHLFIYDDPSRATTDACYFADIRSVS